jgi:hypothetical protein
MNKNYIESTENGFRDQLKNFYSKLDIHGALLGFSVAEIAEAKADSLFWDYCLNADNLIEKTARDYKKNKNLLRFGKGTEIFNGLPAIPALGTAPTAVAGNIQLRFSKKAAKAKSSPNYTKAIGTDLGIESTLTTFDPTVGKPVLSFYMNGGHPELEYTKKGYNGLCIYKDSGEGYKLLATAFQSHYRDKTELPINGTALWKYKAIYLWHDEETGEWSDELSVVVKG